ncbi:hypothetical protein AAMO2058_000977300 [Amorphochlora amoebiformis]
MYMYNHIHSRCNIKTEKQSPSTLQIVRTFAFAGRLVLQIQQIQKALCYPYTTVIQSQDQYNIWAKPLKLALPWLTQVTLVL